MGAASFKRRRPSNIFAAAKAVGCMAAADAAVVFRRTTKTSG